MAQLNSQVGHVFMVNDLFGAPVTGLTGASFTMTLRRRSGSTLIPTAELVTIQAIGGGEYWAFYTPTIAATLYTLTVIPVAPTQITNPYQWEDEVTPVIVPVAGPYLTTRDNVKDAFGFKSDEHDERIDQLLPQVTDLFEQYCGRRFISSEVTEYPPALSSCIQKVLVKKPPITAVTSVHFSQGVPRVYDATTLLVAGTDYVISEDGQWIELATPRYMIPPLARATRIIYTGGYATVPGDLERAAQEVLGVKLLKGSGRFYHLLGTARDDGSVTGLRFDDVTPNAQDVLDSYRLRLVA